MNPAPLVEHDAVITPSARHAVVLGPATSCVAGRFCEAFVRIRYLDDPPDRPARCDERTTTIARLLLRRIEPGQPLPPPVRIAFEARAA